MNRHFNVNNPTLRIFLGFTLNFFTQIDMLNNHAVGLFNDLNNLACLSFIFSSNHNHLIIFFNS